MATTAVTLIQRTRRFLGDWPENDASTASISSNGTSLTVTDTTQYSPGWLIQVDTEAMYVSALASATALTVRRGVRGTTAASHVTASTVVVRPHFFDIEYLDALNSAINACFPMLYQPVVDETTVTAAGTYEYTIPNLNSVPIPYISKVFYKETGDLTYREFKSWEVERGSTPKIKMRRDVPTGLLRVYGFGPLPPLSATTDSLNTLFPVMAEDALVFFAAQYLLSSGEARRVREDTGARDDRESANRTGSSMAASREMLTRFYNRLQQCAMPPMPKNVKSVI